MKLLTSSASWKQWIEAKEGRFAQVQHPQPGMYPVLLTWSLRVGGSKPSVRSIFTNMTWNPWPSRF